MQKSERTLWGFSYCTGDLSLRQPHSLLSSYLFLSNAKNFIVFPTPLSSTINFLKWFIITLDIRPESPVRIVKNLECEIMFTKFQLHF